MEVKKLEKRNLSLSSVRKYLGKIAESIEKISRRELHVSGAKNRFYSLSSLSLDHEAFFVNLAIITTDKKMQMQIGTELLDWLDKHPLFSTHEWDFERKQL